MYVMYWRIRLKKNVFWIKNYLLFIIVIEFISGMKLLDAFEWRNEYSIDPTIISAGPWWVSTANKTYFWVEKFIKISLENLSLNRFFAVLLVCQ